MGPLGSQLPVTAKFVVGWNWEYVDGLAGLDPKFNVLRKLLPTVVNVPAPDEIIELLKPL